MELKVNAYKIVAIFITISYICSFYWRDITSIDYILIPAIIIINALSLIIELKK